jgi:hypothetical protein
LGIAIRIGTFGLTWRTVASAANLEPTQVSLASLGRFGYEMCQAPGQTNGGREAEQNRLEEEERGRVRCAGLLGIALGLRRRDFCLRLLRPPPRDPSSDHIQRNDLTSCICISVPTSSWLSYRRLPFAIDRHIYIPTSPSIFHTWSCNDQNYPSASTCKSPSARLLLRLRSSEPKLSCMFLVVDIFHPLQWSEQLEARIDGR